MCSGWLSGANTACSTQRGKPALLSFEEREKDDVKKGLQEVKRSQPFSGVFGTLQHLPQPRAKGAAGLYQRGDGPCICWCCSRSALTSSALGEHERNAGGEETQAAWQDDVGFFLFLRCFSVYSLFFTPQTALFPGWGDGLSASAQASSLAEAGAFSARGWLVGSSLGERGERQPLSAQACPSPASTGHQLLPSPSRGAAEDVRSYKGRKEVWESFCLWAFFGDKSSEEELKK